MAEIRTAIPDEIDRYLDSVVRTGPFASKAELVRAALVAFAATAGPIAQGFDKDNTVAPDGRIYQLEYAREASRRGAPGVGIVYKEGVLLVGSTPTNHKLARPPRKVEKVGDRLALLSSGLVPDAYILLRRVRQLQPKATDEVIDALVQLYWEHSIDKAKRPLGVALLVGSTLDGEPRLFYFDPSGAYIEYEAVAVGEGDEKLQEFLEERYRKGTAAEAEKLALEALGKPERYEAVHLSA
jgi:20S proteasome alpha/beta subunit